MMLLRARSRSTAVAGRTRRAPQLPPALAALRPAWKGTGLYFSSSSWNLAPKGRRTALPLFDYRQQMDGVRPTVHYTTDAEEADDFLEAIRSKRLAIELVCDEKQRFIGRKTYVEEGEDVCLISIADAEGVVALHLSEMKKLPTRLKGILEDETIVKQGCGVHRYARKLMSEHAKYHAMVEGFLDLRSLSEDLLPDTLGTISDTLPTADFQSKMIDVILGRGFTTPGISRMKGMNLDGTAALDDIYNMTWATHLLGLRLHDILDGRSQAQVSSYFPEGLGQALARRNAARVLDRHTCSWRDVC